MAEDMGTCNKHGKFNLHDGCPQCQAEARADYAAKKQKTVEAPPEPEDINGVPFKSQFGHYNTHAAKPDALTGQAYLDVVCSKCKTYPQCEGSNMEDCIRRDRETTSTPTSLVKVNPESDVEVKSFYAESLKLQKYAEARVVATGEDYKLATDDLTIIRRLKRALEEKRKDYLAPFQDHIKEVNDAFKRLGEPILLADKFTSDKMLAFTVKQNLIRQAQEEINRKRMEAAQAEMKLKGELSETINLVEVLPEQQKTIRTDVGTVSQRDNWKYEVVDFSLLPDEYKEPNIALLTRVVKASKGQLKINGVRIYNEPILATR